MLEEEEYDSGHQDRGSGRREAGEREGQARGRARAGGISSAT